MFKFTDKKGELESHARTIPISNLIKKSQSKVVVANAIDYDKFSVLVMKALIFSPNNGNCVYVCEKRSLIITSQITNELIPIVCPARVFVRMGISEVFFFGYEQRFIKEAQHKRHIILSVSSMITYYCISSTEKATCFASFPF